MNESQLREIRADLLDPHKGYALVRGLYTAAEIDDYRDECDRFICKCLRPLSFRRIYARITTDDIFDYVQPRTPLEDGSTAPPGSLVTTYRIYQYMHNKHTADTTRFLEKTLSLRDEIETEWANKDPLYGEERARLKNFIIVTKYVEEDEGLPRHRDARPDEDIRYPLLQAVVLLTEPEVDYNGGELVLFSDSGKAVGSQNDLGARKGDVLFFDKSLWHEVQAWRKNPASDLGRWSVIIGARANRRGQYNDRFKYGALNNEFIVPFKTKIKNRIKIALGRKAV